MFLLFVLYALAAGSFTLAKAGLFFAKPIFFVALRMLIAGVLLLTYYFFRYRSFPARSKKDLVRFLLIVGVHIYLSFVLDLVALEFMTSSKGAFIYNLSPFIAALVSYFYFSERMNLKKWLGLSIGFIGFLPEFIIQAPAEKALGGIGVISWPEIMMVGSAISSVVGWIIMRSLVKDGYSPFFVNGVGMIGGGLLALATSPVFERWDSTLVTNWPSFLYILALVILVANILFYNLYGYLLKFYTATFLAFAGFMVPLFAALFGWLFLDEPMAWHFFFSLFLVSIGLAIFYSEELKQGYVTH